MGGLSINDGARWCGFSPGQRGKIVLGQETPVWSALVASLHCWRWRQASRTRSIATPVMLMSDVSEIFRSQTRRHVISCCMRHSYRRACHCLFVVSMVAVSSAQHFHGTLLQITLAHRGVLPCSGKSSSQRVGGQRGLGTENRILALLPAIFELTNRKQKMVVECCARLACDETKAGPLFVACRTQTPRGKMGTGTGIKCRNHRGETQSRANRLLVKPVDDDGWGTSATFRGALYPSKH
jgi:hypothetical protein